MHRLSYARNDSGSSILAGKILHTSPRSLPEHGSVVPAARSSRAEIFRRAPKFPNRAHPGYLAGRVRFPVIFSYVLYLSRRVHYTLVPVTRSWRASARTNKIFRVNEVRDATSPVEPLISTSHTWIQLRRTSIRESALPGFFSSPSRTPLSCAYVCVHVYTCVCVCRRFCVLGFQRSPGITAGSRTIALHINDAGLDFFLYRRGKNCSIKKLFSEFALANWNRYNIGKINFRCLSWIWKKKRTLRTIVTNKNEKHY